MAKKTHKDQHAVPRSYLSSWCDPATPPKQEPYVWLFPRTGGVGKRRAPVNTFTENDLYTIRTAEGERDLRLEHGLSTLEGKFVKIRRDILLRARQPSEEQMFFLSAFVAALHTRTFRFRDHHAQHWQKIVDMGDEILRNMATKTIKEKRRAAAAQLPPSGPTMDLEEARTIAASPLQSLMPTFIESEMRFLPHMQHTVLLAEDGCFITSDNPVSWHDPDMLEKPLIYRHPALTDERLEILMPVSPEACLMITHGEPPGPGLKPVIYKVAPADVVDLVNRRTSVHSGEIIVANTDAAKLTWFT